MITHIQHSTTNRGTMLTNNTFIHLGQGEPTVTAHEADGHAWVAMRDGNLNISIHYDDTGQLEDFLNAVLDAACGDDV